MASEHAQSIILTVDDDHRVSALLMLPSSARACYVFAHGAGAGMTHPSMATVANALWDRQIATLRFQFPYMESGSRRPDPPPLCHATIRAAVAEATRLTNGLPLIAGGRSFGGRMTSQAQAKIPLPGVRGLVFLGFPLHPARRPGTERALHLPAVHVPMLFIQGDRDELAELTLLQPLVSQLGSRATLKLVENANHSLHVAARTGRNDHDVVAEVAATLSDWISQVIKADGPMTSTANTIMAR